MYVQIMLPSSVARCELTEECFMYSSQKRFLLGTYYDVQMRGWLEISPPLLDIIMGVML